MKPMSAASDRIVWIDCEMTGLDVERDELVEIAVFVTDFNLNILDDGIDIVIRPSQSALDGMGEFVRNMHTESGLLDAIPSGVALDEAERQVLEYVRRHVPNPRTAPLGGNTIGTDRTFIARYMPELDTHLHYRSIDVSSIKELSRRWFPRAYFNAPEKHGGHRASADILESIRELRYYRDAVFVAEPGPTSDNAKNIAARVTDGFAHHLVADAERMDAAAGSNE